MCKVSRAFCKVSRISGENGRFRAQAKCGIRVKKCLQQPTSKKAGAAGNKNSASAKLFPQLPGVRKHMLEILAE